MDRDADNPLSDRDLLKLLQRSRNAVEGGLSIDAEETIGKIFAIAGEWVERNPSPDWDLTIEASECESRGDWHGAEIAYQKILGLAKEQPHALYTAHRNLGALYLLLNRDALALEHRRKATAAARREDLTILLLMALREESWCLVHCSQVEQAKKLVAEVFLILGEDDNQNCTQFLGSNLVLRARCSTADHQLSEAQTDLDSAHELFEPMARVKVAAGIQADLARWWATVGLLRTAQHDIAGAVQAWQEAVAHSKHVNSLPHCADVYTESGVAYMLQGLADALIEAGRVQEAQNTAAERTAIMEHLGVPPDQGPED